MSDIRKWKALIESAYKVTENDTEDMAHTDHEVSMAKSQLLSAVKSSTRIAKQLQGKSEEEGLEGWVASKLTMAEDYLQAVADHMDGQEINEGYKVMPPMDPKYVARKGLEGPFTTLSGKVVYYDPKEGSYYDPDTDIYLSYDEFQNYDKDYSGMKDERDEVKEAKLSPEQREELDDLIDMVKYGTSPSTYDNNAHDEAMQALKTIRGEFGDKVADQVTDGIHDFHFPKHGMTPGTYKTDRLASKKPTVIKKDGKIDSRSARSTKRDIKYNLRGMGEKDPKRLGEAGGYYTQPVYDMIKQHGYEKVMHELLTSLDADQIQDFISRADLDESGLRPSFAKELRNAELNKGKGAPKSGKTTGPDDYDFLKYKNKKQSK